MRTHVHLSYVILCKINLNKVKLNIDKVYSQVYNLNQDNRTTRGVKTMFTIIERFHDHDDGHHRSKIIAHFDTEIEAEAAKQALNDNNKASDCISFHIEFPEDHSGLSDWERQQENWIG